MVQLKVLDLPGLIELALELIGASLLYVVALLLELLCESAQPCVEPFYFLLQAFAVVIFCLLQSCIFFSCFFEILSQPSAFGLFLFCELPEVVVDALLPFELFTQRGNLLSHLDVVMLQLH